MRVSKMRNYDSSNDTRKCSCCNKWLSILNYSSRVKKLKSGEKVLNYREICKECSRIKLAAWGKPSREHLNEKHIKNPLRDILNSAKARAKKYNLQFNITKEDVVIPEMCPYLNIPILVNRDSLKANSPSLDRIDNTKGYIKGNVMIISHKANTCKNNLTLDELKLFANNIIGVLNKQGELLENPITVSEDNQQPSLSSNTFEGSTTNSRVLNKDSNANTSALPFNIDSEGFATTNYNDIVVRWKPIKGIDY